MPSPRIGVLVLKSADTLIEARHALYIIRLIQAGKRAGSTHLFFEDFPGSSVRTLLEIPKTFPDVDCHLHSPPTLNGVAALLGLCETSAPSQTSHVPPTSFKRTHSSVVTKEAWKALNANAALKMRGPPSSGTSAPSPLNGRYHPYNQKVAVPHPHARSKCPPLITSRACF